MTFPRGRAFLAALMLGFVLILQPPFALAQPATPGSAPDPVAVLDEQTSELRAVDRLADRGTGDVDDLTALRNRAASVQTRANEAVGLLVPQLQGIDSRIKELGEASEGEAADIQLQRRRLAGERSDVDSAIKRGRLLALDAGQATERIIRALDEEFNRNIFQEAASPLSPALWTAIAAAFPDDRARLVSFASRAAGSFAAGITGANLLIVASGLVIAFVLLFPVRRKLRRIGRRVAIEQAPGSRARRSGLALWFVLVGTLTGTLAFVSVMLALGWADVLSYDAAALARVVAITASVGAFVISLGEGLLLVGQPSWRLLPVGEEAARRLRPYPAWTAGLTVAGVILIEANKIVGASQPATAAANALVAFTYAALIVSVLLTIHRLRRDARAARAAKAAGDAKSPAGRHHVATTLVTLATILAWATVIVSLVSSFQGYVNFSLFLGRQTIWIAIVLPAAYLLLVVVDDFCTGLLSGESGTGRAFQAGLGLSKSQVSQLGVVLSAILRVGVVLAAALMITAPFGPGTSSLFYQIGDAWKIDVGGFSLDPGAIARAVVAFALGLLAVRGLRHWLDERYLPTTDLDPGARNSVSMIVGYAGIILAGFWSLSALGIGVERLALVVSALSVGIGFGLQAITQNFISGLILLAERPVKIGDTVRIGADEGDVKRISVRATEIQIADRSTLIVPNSELITKTVRNMTLSNPLGRIQIAFAAPIDVDAGHLRTILLDVYGSHPDVLDDPGPVVYIDGIGGGQVSFNSFAFVGGPRLVYAARSSLLFVMLDRFRAEGITLVAPAA